MRGVLGDAGLVAFVGTADLQRSGAFAVDCSYDDGVATGTVTVKKA